MSGRRGRRGIEGGGDGVDRGGGEGEAGNTERSYWYFRNSKPQYIQAIHDMRPLPRQKPKFLQDRAAREKLPMKKPNNILITFSIKRTTYYCILALWFKCSVVCSRTLKGLHQIYTSKVFQISLVTGLFLKLLMYSCRS